MQIAPSLQSKQNKCLVQVDPQTQQALPCTATALPSICTDHTVKVQVVKVEQYVPATGLLKCAASKVVWPSPSMLDAEYSSLSSMYMCAYFRCDVLRLTKASCVQVV